MARVGRAWRSVLLLLAVALTVGCDQVSKAVAARSLAGGGTLEVLGGAIRLQLASNQGAFLGMGSRLPEGARFGLLVVLVGVGLGIGVALLLRSRQLRFAPALGLALVLGGGLGNLVDRALSGTVRDFAVIELGPLRTGVFNAADAAIVAGAALAALASTRTRRE